MMELFKNVIVNNIIFCRFSPMVFLYLSSTIPSVFLLELELLETRILISNSTMDQDTLEQETNFSTYTNWAQILEQIMVLVLVVGRWLAPKGEMNRDQLTQLLLLYIGLGADILDMLNMIKTPGVDTNWQVAIAGLCLFSCALLQFTLVLTQSSDPPETNNEQDTQTPVNGSRRSCCASEVWSLLSGLCQQDGPFLVFRLYLSIGKQVIDELMIFFICKNALTVIIEIYRIIIIHVRHRRQNT
ncbi:Hypothetical predicted protein [Pelobates cultripes]|uniref:Transmembrane protein 26 n=1 Tax=Pelobates cultripes TaxID=61616 RepID=A0AAD1T6Y7_PELCU|nr:Hypothetical predicted protein [Pelobates cultripes]